MTFDQIRIFVAVAEREHLTQAAAVLNLTPSAVSASIKALEARYGVRLFERVGRGIELTRAGRTFLAEARQTMARVKSAELVLGELGDLRRGSVDIHASQTIANYWLPQRLMHYRALYPNIEIRLVIANTSSVTRAVTEGIAELGFIEGSIDEPQLSVTVVAQDRLVVVVPAGAAFSAPAGKGLTAAARDLPWILREPGSGTRSEFEAALRAASIDPSSLNVAMTLPSNEAVLSAVRGGRCATALSRFVVEPFVQSGELKVLDISLPPRNFTILHHKERHLSAAATRLAESCRTA